jgi:wyosine [tRNA(Phe)-imidazoG37] synthetase (radical SAM superfamily)
MKYVFGPVPSRRLGQSLGIDTIPLKTCNWNCVYCQLGRTIPLINQRSEYYPPEDILSEVKESLTDHREIDWITFVGSGEPTLHSSLGWLIRQVKELTDLPLAVITNGSLLYMPEVRRELAEVDVVMPSLDAGTAALYLRLNRPHPDVTFERLVDGLISFQNEYDGQVWIEVMLVQGLNDTEAALQDIAAVLRRIQPDEVHINLPTRPPAEIWVRPPDVGSLVRAMEILGDSAKLVKSAEGSFDLSGHETIVDAIIRIITRHPMDQKALERTLTRWAPGRVREALAELRASGRAQVVERLGKRFWSAAASHYPDNIHSQASAPSSCRHPSRSSSMNGDMRDENDNN